MFKHKSDIGRARRYITEKNEKKRTHDGFSWKKRSLNMPSGRNQPFLPFTSTFAGCCSGPGNTFTLRERIALPTTASRISGRISFSSVSFTVNVYCVTMSS